MVLTSTNPATGQVLQTYPIWDLEQLGSFLSRLPDATADWARKPLAERVTLLEDLARAFRERREHLARQITLEMGKPFGEALSEIDKCALGCDYYGENANRFLATETIITDASYSYVAYEPLGTILAIMPWNFPFWQVIRATLPALVAGNTIVLKHAPIVTGCALALESVFRETGFPDNVFKTLPIPEELVENLISDPRIHGVSFTGSVATGRKIAALAGANLKKSVLELGGSDPFIVLEDADLELAVQQAFASRFINGGQSCVAAKRFILVEKIAEEFLMRLLPLVKGLRPGDPLEPDTTLPPLARKDLRDTLHRQVSDSIAAGASATIGCRTMDGPGHFYYPSILDQVKPGMPAFDEELFGPVAALVRATDEADAIHLANRSCYGLGGSVWTSDTVRGERVARQIECGMSFVNGMVKSDPRLPCGGIKDSGYGRELSEPGVREFTNIRTVWVR